jgi:acyl carrier protein
MSADLPSDRIKDRIKVLLRRDLKLGQDAVIEDDTPLMGGEYDLDSVDVLLMVASVEKEFGISIPNEAVGKQAFTDVTTLARFVEQHVE